MYTPCRHRLAQTTECSRTLCTQQKSCIDWYHDAIWELKEKLALRMSFNIFNIMFTIFGNGGAMRAGDYGHSAEDIGSCGKQ